MRKMNNLPMDLLEEILSRVPVTSLKRVQSTCKKWNTLSKDESFTKKHLAQQATARREGEFVAIALMNRSLNLMSVNLHNNSDLSVKSIGKLISLNDSDELNMSRLCYCDGLLLCTTLDHASLVVWNPYIGQTRWICVEHKFVHDLAFFHYHALGYDKNRTFKILRYVQDESVHEIYELSSNSCSWRVLDVNPDWEIDYDNSGLSLKGNTYWYAQDKGGGGVVACFLLCFDLTRERFGPRLPLPFESFYAETLSSVRDEQLAVFFDSWDTYEMEVWVTTKIEPNAVSWSKLLAVGMNPVSGFPFCCRGSFLTNEERKAAVFLYEDKDTSFRTQHIAYITGENRYNTRGKSISSFKVGFPHAVSYVPSSVQINQFSCFLFFLYAIWKVIWKVIIC